jgi:hypothetical protein
MFEALRKIIWMFIPDPDFFSILDPDPGTKKNRIPDPDSQQ